MKLAVCVLGLATVGTVLLVRLNPPETRYPQIGPVSPEFATVMARLRARIGSKAPELAFHFLDDDSPHRLSDFRGRAVLLTVWVRGCGPCWAEMPTLTDLQELHGSDRLAVIPLTSSSPDRVRKSAEKLGVTLPPLSSYSEQMSWVRNIAGPQRPSLTTFFNGWVPNMAWPLTIVIDREGVIREVTFGRRSDEQLEASVRGYV
jgi:peroxiredoxin